MPVAPRRQASPISKHKFNQTSSGPEYRSRLSAVNTNVQLGAGSVVSDQSCFSNEESFSRLISESFWPFSENCNSRHTSKEARSRHVDTSARDPGTSLCTQVPSSRSRISSSRSVATMDDSDDHKSKSSKGSKKSTGCSRQGTDPSRNRPQRGRRTSSTSTHRCEICNQYYSRRDNLRVHQRVHSGEMPYECKYCGQRFRWMGSLRGHESNHERSGEPMQNARQTSGSHSSSRQSSSRQSSTKASSSRQSSGRPPSSTGHSNGSRPSSSRDHRNASSSSSRGRKQIPQLHLANHTLRGQDIIVTEEDPGVSPIFQEPWHHVLDDDRQ